ncbi:MAG TPA: CBS domain-containing protein, partial [Anaerolineae bacterium]|nr:CBS domain-containing protein [Anaerolineae bacterium]
PRRPNRNLRDFLTLYWDELPYVRYEDLPRRVDIDRIILVDTQTLVTPKGMTDDTEVQIIDHHPLARELPPSWSYSGEEVGATATLLVERLVAARHSLTPVEATLLTLGIYEDTGSLTYPTTTARDLRCAAWLAEHGANLAVVSDFLHHGLTDQQLALYDALLDSAEVVDVAGHTIVVATATAEGYVEEISTLAHKIRDLYDPAGLFLIVDLGEYLQLVARSTTDSVDVGHIATHFGGGGHTRAAAALIREQHITGVRDELLDLLDRHIHPSVTVSQLMSYGVQTLSPETTVDAATEEMLRYGFEGFPVVDAAGHILGVLTRREIDRARRLHLGNMPVRHYMTKGDISVTPDDSIERLQQVMTQHGVGQVPVVDNGEILGVVTRTDLIKLWTTPTRAPTRRRDIAQRIEATLPTALLDLLRVASDLAQELGYPLYVVGGFVRDLLLGEPNLDMDLVVEGDAIRLARRVARQIDARTRSHRRFGTAKIILEGRENEYGIPSLDFATARLEFYAHSAALPEVESGNIKADLHRRDFTINTLAIRLDSDHYGRLLDFYGGEEDLRNGVIRVLHSLSFIEDPTRIMRAARFEQRLGFEIEPRTAELIENALPMLSRVSAERLRHELYLIFAESEPERVLRRLDQLGVLHHIHPNLSCTDHTCSRFATLRHAVAGGTWDVRHTETGAPAPGLYLATWVYHLSREDIEAVASQLKPFRQDLDLLREVSHLHTRFDDLDRPDLTNAQIYALLRRTGSEARFVTWVGSHSERVRDRLLLYETELRHVEPVVDGAYLKSLGLKPSPLFGELLDAVRDARLNDEIETEEEEKALIARRLAAQPEDT